MDTEYVKTLLASNPNYAPSDTEITNLREVLKDQVAEAAKIELEIVRMGGLLRFQEIIGDSVQNFLTLLSPSHKLPTEILRKVFIFCLPPKQNALMDRKAAPLLLTEISREWRDIAISTSLLWATIHIPVLYRRHPTISHTENKARSTHLNEAVKRWLDRSGTSRLSISLAEIRLGESGADVSDDPGRAVFHLLKRYSSRWYKLEFSGSSLLPRVMALTPTEVPSLCSVSVKAPSSCQLSSINSVASKLFSGPRIEGVRLGNMSGSVLDYQISWLNLKELFVECHGSGTTHPFGARHALAILGKCKNLEVCHLNVFESDPAVAQESNENEYTLPFLREMTFIERGSSIGRGFWKSIIAPGLKFFKFFANSRPLRKEDPGTPAFFPASEMLCRVTALETLILDPDRLSHSLVINCLMNTPRLTTLIFQAAKLNQIFLTYSNDGNSIAPALPVVSDELLSFLTPSLSSTLLMLLKPSPSLPKYHLRVLESITFGQSNSVSDEVLLQFIRTRASHLRAITGTFSRAASIDIVQFLSREISMGLNVDLHYMEKKRKATFNPHTGVKWNESETQGCLCEHCFDFDFGMTL